MSNLITTIGVRLQSRDGTEETVSVTAEPTPATGLFIVPEISGGELTGHFTLTHGASGLRMPADLGGGGLLRGAFCPEELNVARRVGKELATTPVDWTLDRDRVVAQVQEHSATVLDAVRRAKLPPAEATDSDGDVETGPAPYPRTEAQVTAATLARHLTRGMQYRTAATWKLIGAAKPNNKAGMDLYMGNLHALIAEYGLVYLLREIAKLDQDVADKLARDIWNAWEDGGSVHEFTGEWAAYYELPEITDDGDGPPPEMPARPVGFRMLTEPGKLPYFEGSVNDLRRVIAFTAYTAEQRYGDLVDAGRTLGTPWPEEHVRDTLIANSAAHFGWTLVALLRRLSEINPDLARQCAAMLDDIGVNGGNDLMDDLPTPPTMPDLGTIPEFAERVGITAAAQPAKA